MPDEGVATSPSARGRGGDVDVGDASLNTTQGAPLLLVASGRSAGGIRVVCVGTRRTRGDALALCLRDLIPVVTWTKRNRQTLSNAVGEETLGRCLSRHVRVDAAARGVEGDHHGNAILYPATDCGAPLMLWARSRVSGEVIEPVVERRGPWMRHSMGSDTGDSTEGGHFDDELRGSMLETDGARVHALEEEARSPDAPVGGVCQQARRDTIDGGH